MDCINEKSNEAVEIPESSTPIIISNSQFIGLQGCISIVSSNIVNISKSIIHASYIEATVYIYSAHDINIEKTCISSCMSSVKLSRVGDILSLKSYKSISITFYSMTNCYSNLTSVYPNGYLDNITGTSVWLADHNSSYNYGYRMPGNCIFASDLIFKHCYTGHNKCGVCIVQLTIYEKSQIKQIVLESPRSTSAPTRGFYTWNCTVPVTIEECVFWDIDQTYELYTSYNTLTALGCFFSSSSPSLGDNVIASSQSNHFGVSHFKSEAILCYDQIISCKQFITRILMVVSFSLSLVDLIMSS